MRVEDKNLNEIRFRSDVYKMLSEPDKSVPYAIPDTKFDNFSEREFDEKVASFNTWREKSNTKKEFRILENNEYN